MSEVAVHIALTTYCKAATTAFLQLFLWRNCNSSSAHCSAYSKAITGAYPAAGEAFLAAYVRQVCYDKAGTAAFLQLSL